MLSRLRFAISLLMSLGWVPRAWAQAPTPVQPDSPPPAAQFPAAPPPAEPAPLPPPPAAPVPVAPAVTPPPVSPAPPEPPSAPDPARRKGFYAALQLGGGYFHASSGSDADPRRFNGGTVSGMLAIGGRVGRPRRVTLAGAFIRDQVFALRSHDAVIDGDEPHLDDVTFALWAVAFLVDVAAQPAEGLHFQGLAGVGALSVSRDSGDPENPAGLMASLGVGYDFRVSKGLALGALLRATYAPLDVDESLGTTVYIVVPALLLTVSTR